MQTEPRKPGPHSNKKHAVITLSHHRLQNLRIRRLRFYSDHVEAQTPTPKHVGDVDPVKQVEYQDEQPQENERQNLQHQGEYSNDGPA